MSSPVPGPGLPHQSTIRTALRVVGPLVALAGLALLVVAMVDFFQAMGSFTQTPDKFWMGFVGMPVLVVGAWMCMAGYAGAVARYGAGETMPVVKDAAAYLSDGLGVAGVGRTAGDSPASGGPYCRGCGTRNDEEARFCDSCGQSLA